jgi:trehalose synthase
VGVGVDARWFVVEGDPAFFDITKRIDNHLDGDPGDPTRAAAVLRGSGPP